MRLGGIHYKGEDIIRAYKNGVMVWHLVDFIFYNCDNVELFALPYAELYSSNTWNAKKEECSIELSDFYPLYASKGEGAYSFLDVSNILNIEFYASSSKKSDIKEEITLDQETTARASLGIGSIGEEQISLISNIIGYASTSASLLPKELIKWDLIIPALVQPARDLNFVAEQLIAYYFLLLNQPSHALLQEGGGKLAVFAPMHRSATRENNGNLETIVNNRLLLITQKSGKLISDSSFSFYERALIDTAITKNKKIQNIIKTEAQNRFDIDKRKIVGKVFLNKTEDFLLLDSVFAQILQNSYSIFGFVLSLMDLVETKKMCFYKSFYGKNNNILYTSISGSSSISNKEKINNLSLLKKAETSPYLIEALETFLPDVHLENSNTKKESLFILEEFYNNANLEILKSKMIETFHKVLFQNRADFIFSLTSPSLYSYVITSKDCHFLQLDEISLIKISNWFYSFSFDILKTPWSGKVLTNTILNSYGKANIDNRADTSIKLRVWPTSFSGTQIAMEPVLDTLLENKILLSSKVLLEGGVLTPWNPWQTISSHSLPFLEFIDSLKAPFSQLVESTEHFFLEFDKGLLFFKIASMINSFGLTNVELLRALALNTKDFHNTLHSYLNLSFLDSFSGLDEKNESCALAGLVKSKIEAIKDKENIVSSETITIAFTDLQDLKRGDNLNIFYTKALLKDTSLFKLEDALSYIKYDEYLILQDTVFTDFNIKDEQVFTYSGAFVDFSATQDDKSLGEIQNGSCSILSFNDDYRWLYPYYLDYENTELFIYQVKNFSYANKSFI